MYRTADNSINRRANVQCFALALLLGALSCAASAQTNATPPTGVRNSPGPGRLNKSQLQMVQQSLRQKTGFMELGFDEQGVLTLGNRTRVAGGSATARGLLASAVDGSQSFILESHHASAQIAFARLKWTTITYLASLRIQEYALQLDFSDFDHLSGDKEAVAAFDLGIALLHELTHGVRHLQDDKQNQFGLGECEVYVNQMRRELNLPERQHYLGRVADRTNTTKGMAYRVELWFARSVEGRTRPRSQEFLLYWWTEQVGGV